MNAVAVHRILREGGVNTAKSWFVLRIAGQKMHLLALYARPPTMCRRREGVTLV